MTFNAMLRSRRVSIVAAWLLAAACTTTAPPPAISPTPPALHGAVRFAQLDYGPHSEFERCGKDGCPHRTPKTLASAAPAPLPTATAAVDSPSSDVIESGPSPSTATQRAFETRADAALRTHQLDVQFAFASAQLSAVARSSLQALASELARARQVGLYGRTDSVGPTAANTLLAKARAEAVLRALTTSTPGIASITTIDAQGACCFVEANDTPAGRARNRRVEIRYLLEPDDPS
jgi:outer membrane protein OmpA-like peptidoglycan-associated protein